MYDMILMHGMVYHANYILVTDKMQLYDYNWVTDICMICIGTDKPLTLIEAACKQTEYLTLYNCL